MCAELAENTDNERPDDLEEQLRQYILEEQQRKEDQVNDFFVAADEIAYVIGLIADFLDSVYTRRVECDRIETHLKGQKRERWMLPTTDMT